MIKRHHELQVGEQVYDLNSNLIYHITVINEDGTIGLAMTDEDIQENKLMFDCEIVEEEYEYTTNAPNMLYQFVPGLVGRDGSPICYEHCTEIGWAAEDEGHEEELFYPYFSPYLEENLFTFETFTQEEYEAR